MNPRIAGQSVERVSFDYAVTLLTDQGVELRIETGFSLLTPDGDIHLIDPQRIGNQAEYVIAALHETITVATIEDRTGELTLEFISGRRIQVDSNESYEAWTLAGPGGAKFVSLPGGGLGTWRSEP